MNREQILQEATKCVCGGRDIDHGTPEDNFGMIAKFWNIYLGDNVVSSADVAIMMGLLKIARIRTGGSTDSYIDLAGYAACAGQLAETVKR